MIGAYLSFSVVQASLPGLLASRAFPPFSLLTKRIPAISAAINGRVWVWIGWHYWLYRPSPTKPWTRV